MEKLILKVRKDYPNHGKLQSLHSLINSFRANVPILYLRFSDVLRGYKMGTLDKNVLMSNVSTGIQCTEDIAML